MDIHNSEGANETFRALFDSGFHSSLISQKTSPHLGLQKGKGTRLAQDLGQTGTIMVDFGYATFSLRPVG